MSLIIKLPSLAIKCLLAAAAHQHIPAPIMWGIYGVERGHLGSVAYNQVNGSHDLGYMQINDRTWIPRIAAMDFNGNTKNAITTVLYDTCYNMQISAWIYKQYLVEAKYDYGTAIGYYNSHTPSIAIQYKRMFEGIMKQIYNNELVIQKE